MLPHYQQDFGPFDGRTWLNCAHQGPLPRTAIEAASEALEWKISPGRLNDEAFYEIPQKLKRALGQLINVPPEEIILGNSTSYGIHLLANGIPWKPGDEVLLVNGDFPANILPWRALEKRGVVVRFIHPQRAVPEAGEISSSLSPATRLFCTSWVNSFDGYAIDIQAMGRACRENGTLFMVNGSQALGAKALDLSSNPVDAFTSCGFKWLCGPYGTGFCWVRPDVLERLEYNQAYWLTMQQGQSLDRMREYTIRDDMGASAYDVFCTANFLNFLPWTKAVEYLIEQGVERIEEYDHRLVSHLISRLDPEKYKLLSPRQDLARSTLVLMTHREPYKNRDIFLKLKREGFDISLREGNLRISPHLYNSVGEIDGLLSQLHEA